MSLQKDLDELLKADVITQETADKIDAYYQEKTKPWTSRLFTIFGALGAILVGLGIILIVAHNWDELNRSSKTILAFLPLVIGQVLCAYTLLRKSESTVWRESSATFLFFAIGASISLVSQIYQINGNLSNFLLTWTLLSLPLVYLLKSSVTSLLYLVGISYYATEEAYWTYPHGNAFLYWPLLLAAIPYYYQRYRTNPDSNFVKLHHWFFPLSLTVCLGCLSDFASDWMYLAYMNLFGCFLLLGHSQDLATRSRAFLPMNNGYRIIGSLGTLWILITLSFDWFWNHLSKETAKQIFPNIEFYAALGWLVVALVLFYIQVKNRNIRGLKPIEFVFIAFFFIFLIGLFSPLAVVLVNLLLLSLGVLIIRQGAKQDHLGIVNFGLLVIAALVLCRFFDSDLSFVIRGLLFIAVGISFFVTNYRLLQKRKTHEA